MQGPSVLKVTAQASAPLRESRLLTNRMWSGSKRSEGSPDAAPDRELNRLSRQIEGPQRQTLGPEPGYSAKTQGSQLHDPRVLRTAGFAVFVVLQVADGR